MLTGGGTGGHITPILAVAHELKNEGDLGQSGEVGPWADLARAQHRAAELGQRDRTVERDTDHEL